MTAFIAAFHQGQAKRLRTRPRQRQANQAAPVLGHEVDCRRIGPVADDTEVPLVLAVFVIDENEQLAGARIGNHILNRRQRRRGFSLTRHMFHFRQDAPHSAPAYRFPC